MSDLKGRQKGRLVERTLGWLCGGALAMNVVLVLALLAILAWNGLGYFWQRPLVQFELAEGSRLLGEIFEIDDSIATEGDDRLRLKLGNRDLGGADFRWIEASEVVEQSRPDDAVLIERAEWGNFYGYPVELRRDDEVLASGAAAVRDEIAGLLAEKRRQEHVIHRLETGPIAELNHELEELRLEERRIELEAPPEGEATARREAIEAERTEVTRRFEEVSEELFAERDELLRETLIVETVGGETQEVAVGSIVRFLSPNRFGFGDRVALYLSRVWEFVSGQPRESNTEGGIFPAIFGTVLMVFLMSFAVAPFGVLAALYLREYATQGPVVRAVRVAVNNLAGVPSIVFGVFGLGFFVYLIGGSIDKLLYPEALPTPTFGTGGILWAALTLALLTVPVVIVATEEGLAAVPQEVRQGSRALGATKFETTMRVVLPAAAPGILTGMILAMARAAGEVAPLMIVGMVKLAPALPIDGTFPYLHLERKFMHLGFHIYDVGFQSPNVEATKPLVFATSLLLIAVVAAMNVGAIVARNHLRRRYSSSAV